MSGFTGMDLILAIVIPAIIAPICFIAGKKIGRVGNGILATIALAISTLLLLGSWNTILSQGQVIENYGVWIGLFKIEAIFLQDHLSFAISVLIAGISTLAAIYSISYMSREHNHEIYFASMLLFVSGMIGVVLSANLILFYVFWEMMLIPSYFLIAYWGSGKPRIVGMKYFLFTHAGAAALIFGILMTFAVTGTFNLLELPDLLTGVAPGILKAIMILMFIGFAVKLAIFPVHTWLPDAHAEAPTPISVLLSGVMIKTGAYAIVRITLTLFPSQIMTLAYGLAILAIITVFWGGIMAFVQTDLKRMLAYSSISQVGYILFGIMCLNVIGIGGGLFNIINHGIAKGLLFMCVGAVIYVTGVRDMKKLGGLASKMPVTAVATLCGGLSIAGTPPFAGFASEWMIFAGGFAAGYTILAFLAVGAAIITAAYYLRMVKRVFFGECPANLSNTKEAPISMLIPISILTFFTVAYGIFAFIPLEVVYPAAEAVMKILMGA
ncbi:NuoM family protein [Thermoproteota archaeon]